MLYKNLTGQITTTSKKIGLIPGGCICPFSYQEKATQKKAEF